MTPGELATYARQRYNAVGDTFFSDPEIYNYIWDAEMQLAKETGCVRAVYTTTTVAAQQEYPYPTNSISIKRVTYNGLEVYPRSLKEVLDLTSSSASGSALIYAIWNETLYLGPIPDDALTLKIWSINEPSEVSATSVLDVPSRYHLEMAEYVNWQMAVKDKNYQGAVVHRERWADILRKAQAFERKMYRGTEFSFTRDADRDVDSLVIAR